MNSIAKMVVGGFSGFLWTVGWVCAGPLESSITLPPAPDMSRAEFFFYLPESVGQCRAVLMLCPGQNGDGRRYLSEAPWREFAEKNQVALGALWFVSPNDILKKHGGYFNAAGGSGALLLEALKRQQLDGKPLFLFGFSGGAHFVNTFSQWSPQSVSGWGAQAVSWWKKPPTTPGSPAIIACGELDGTRYGASLEHFQRGRRLGQPWTWVSIPEEGHRRAVDFEDFVRAYFLSLISARPTPILADLVTKKRLDAVHFQGASVWLPDQTVYELWQSLHQP